MGSGIRSQQVFLATGLSCFLALSMDRLHACVYTKYTCIHAYAYCIQTDMHIHRPILGIARLCQYLQSPSIPRGRFLPSSIRDLLPVSSTEELGLPLTSTDLLPPSHNTSERPHNVLLNKHLKSPGWIAVPSSFLIPHLFPDLRAWGQRLCF